MGTIDSRIEDGDAHPRAPDTGFPGLGAFDRVVTPLEIEKEIVVR